MVKRAPSLHGMKRACRMVMTYLVKPSNVGLISRTRFRDAMYDAKSSKIAVPHPSIMSPAIRDCVFSKREKAQLGGHQHASVSDTTYNQDGSQTHGGDSWQGVSRLQRQAQRLTLAQHVFPLHHTNPSATKKTCSFHVRTTRLFSSTITLFLLVRKHD